MNQRKKIAIIGAGAAGLMAAITAAQNNADVHLFEQNSKPAKKILASGNGRCNISNTIVEPSDFAGEHPEFSRFALESFDFKRLEKFCKSIGLLLNILPDGRAYPLSNEAKSVALSFITFAEQLGVTIINDCAITAITKENDHFYLHADQGIDHAYDALLLATGSEAAPQLGGCATGQTLAQEFGHSIMPTYPSLVQLHLNSAYNEKLAGVKLEGSVSLYINAQKEQTIKGDLLFTKYGISGFAILDVSQKASYALMHYQAVDIGLDLLPGFDRQNLASQLQQMGKNLPEHNIEAILGGMLPLKLVNGLLEALKISPHTKGADLQTKLCKQIASRIKDWRFEVTQTHGFKHAEVAGGGVATLEVNPKTMESELVQGLYFAGELLDIVGRRGGFNIQFAFASGYLAGKSITA